VGQNTKTRGTIQGFGPRDVPALQCSAELTIDLTSSCEEDTQRGIIEVFVRPEGDSHSGPWHDEVIASDHTRIVSARPLTLAHVPAIPARSWPAGLGFLT